MKKIGLMKGLILCFWIILFVPSISWGTISATERAILTLLYNDTGGASWANNTNWLGIIGTECTWYGVTCDAGQTHVTQLHLNANNLTGSITAELGALTSLTFIDLSSNNLIGGIPETFSNLSNLTGLILYGNSLDGIIPPVIGNMSSLTSILVQNNNLTGSIPPELGNLTNLTSLHLYNNNLSGIIPPELGNLSSLTGLFLYGNNLTGSIPPELGTLSNLIRLYLYNNSLSGTIPPELGNLANLTHLSLSLNNLSGNIPPELGNLSNLIFLGLDRNSLTGSIPPELGNLVNLESLFLYSNGLSGSIPSGLSTFPLINCDIDYNGLYSLDPSLTTYLDGICGPWSSSQTVAPDNLAVGTITDTSVDLSWTAIPYTGNTGGYEVHISTVSGGPYAYGDITADKSVENVSVGSLMPGTTYYFVVRTKTDPHANNTNTVLSDFSTEVSAATTGTSLLAATDSIAPVDDYLVPFGGTNIAGPYGTETVQIEYLGGAGFGFTLDSVTIGGANSREFGVDVGDGSGTTCGPLPVDFSSPVSCTVDVTFIPATPGAKSAFLDFGFSTAAVPMVRVSLTGTALNPSINVSALSLDLGDIAVGATSSPMAITVSNTGDGILTVSSADLSGANAGEFAIAPGGTCGSSPFDVAEGASCTINITLTPSSTGGKSAVLTITSNDAVNPEVAVTLSGSSSSPRINVTPVSIDFGNVTEGVVSGPQTVSITNSGSGALTVSGMALSGTNAGEFSLDPDNGTAGTCGSAAPSVPVGGSCTVDITFNPGSTGPKTASLDITSDDPVDSTASVSLSGTGLSSAVNNAPNAPVLVSPEDGATGITVPVTFGWDAATDPDGDTVTYDLYLCQDASFATCPSPENTGPITAAAFRKAVTFAGMTFGIGFIGIALNGALSRRRRLALILAILALFGLVIYGCSGGGGGSSQTPPNTVPGDINYTVSVLDSGATYYWKVVSSDGSASTESEIRSFTTQ